MAAGHLHGAEQLSGPVLYQGAHRRDCRRANILTRSMIIYGQGAIRCHFYVLPEMLAASHPTKSRR